MRAFRMAARPRTFGQSAFLRVVPGRAVAVLTNGGLPRRVYAEVVGRVLHDLGGVELPGPSVPDRAVPPPYASRHVGTHVSSTSETPVSQDARGRPRLLSVPVGVTAEPDEAPYRTRGDSLIPVEPSAVSTPYSAHRPGPEQRRHRPRR
ncbi:hypothetical protein [Streptosporangium saharense]|uniref:hypothetical protein n=1 Tax=Streptosporangium saharense TaxID=1706840 RepID=UPI0034448D7E